MEELLVSLACQSIVSKTELKIVVQQTQNYTECHYNDYFIYKTFVIICRSAYNVSHNEPENS